MLLENKTAVVTGAAHGIGRAIALELAAQGATVYICDILHEELERSREEVIAAAGKCFAQVVDVSSSDQVNDFVGKILLNNNKIDILVNNAGGVCGQQSQPIGAVSDEEWHQIFAVNLDGAFKFTRAVAAAMKTKQNGAIVNISSGAGRSYSLTGIQAYASSKAGLIGLTRQTARELGVYGIRVNCIAPGFIRSNPSTEKQWLSMGIDGQKKVLEGIALRRLGQPSDIAKAVSFFVSDAASWITGQTISVDGGHWMLG